MGKLLDFFHFSLPVLALDGFPTLLASAMCMSVHVRPLPTQAIQIPTCGNTQIQKQSIYAKKQLKTNVISLHENRVRLRNEGEIALL